MHFSRVFQLGSVQDYTSYSFGINMLSSSHWTIWLVAFCSKDELNETHIFSFFVVINVWIGLQWVPRVFYLQPSSVTVCSLSTSYHPLSVYCIPTCIPLWFLPSTVPSVIILKILSCRNIYPVSTSFLFVIH